MLEDLLIGNDSKGSEDDDDGNVASNVGEGRLDRVSALFKSKKKKGEGLSALLEPRRVEER